MFMPSDVTKQPQIDAAVAEIVSRLRPHVLNISYDIAKDWSGDSAIFFHVLLSNHASKGVLLGRVTTEARRQLYETLRGMNIRLIGYSDFRSESELAELQKGRA